MTYSLTLSLVDRELMIALNGRSQGSHCLNIKTLIDSVSKVKVK